MRTTTATSLPPACLQFSPIDPSLLVTGTYLLTPSAPTLETRKTGTLDTYRYHGNSATLTLLHSCPAAAILDLKFSPHTPEILATADSLGQICLYRLSTSTGELTHLASHSVVAVQSGVLVLSLAFSPTCESRIAYTLSSSGVGCLDCETVTVEAVMDGAHDGLEAWAVEFTRDGRGLYSGGDDSNLVFWNATGRGLEEVWRDRRIHGAGVTAVLSEVEGKVVTGSYDESLRVLDVRSRRMVVEEVGLGGGVWRLHRMDQERLLASCMHAGPRIVNLREDGSGLKVVKEWEVMNLNYACDTHAERPGSVAWCSFYDKVLCVDEVPSP